MKFIGVFDGRLRRVLDRAIDRALVGQQASEDLFKQGDFAANIFASKSCLLAIHALDCFGGFYLK